MVVFERLVFMQTFSEAERERESEREVWLEVCEREKEGQSIWRCVA